MKFIDKLTDIKYATQNQRQKELWDVEGILKDRLNQKFKFDLRPLKNNAKTGSFKTKADKVVFDINDKWYIVDVEELHQHLKNSASKVAHLDDLLSKLDWNIILNKV